MSFWKLNRLNKNRSWTLSGDYLKYRNEGGNLSPQGWNERLKEIKHDLGLSVEAKQKMEDV